MMNPFRFGYETLHIALVSFPQNEAKKQADKLVGSLYNPYKKEISKFSNRQDTADYLYNPLKYYLFGNYDVAFISVVNNYKFSQRQVTPVSTDFASNTSETNSFQVITGSCPLLTNSFNLRDFFEKKQQHAQDFICISNFKLNNKLLIGNGSLFLDPLLKLIGDRLKKIVTKNTQKKPFDFFIQQTYSWFEITLLTFSDNIRELADILTSLRRLTLDDLVSAVKDQNKETLLRNSLYSTVLKNKKQYAQVNPHLFADSQSYFGVSFACVHAPKRQVNHQMMETQIEWQVKPGHFPDLFRELKKLRTGAKPMFSGKNYLLTGKTDYLITGETGQLETNIQLIKALQLDTKIFDYARKVKTRLLIPHTIPPDAVSAHHAFHPDFRKDVLRRMADTGDIFAINRQLKQLKVSRNVRNKINKIYYNYNNGIQDPILFTYFLDFSIFMNNLTNIIKDENNSFTNAFDNPGTWKAEDNKQVKQFEEKLVDIIEIFEEGYNIRMLNCHHYEDINDFDLDFNSSIQQVLSTYNTLSAHLSNIYYELNSHSPVVQLNRKNTVSNYASINYDVYHLTSPEFVLFTLVKEVLNKYIYVDNIFFTTANYKRLGRDKSIKQIITELEKEVKESKLKDLYNDGAIDFEYYFIDGVKFIQTCNADIALFEFWFWTYNFQVASLFDETGMMSEKHFKNELTRLFFVAKLFGTEPSSLTCPIPEIYYLWERYRLSLMEDIDSFFINSKHAGHFKLSILSTFIYKDDLPGIKGNTHLTNKQFRDLEGIFTSHMNEDDQSAFWKYAAGPIVLHYLNNLQEYTYISKKIGSGIPVHATADDISNFGFINSFTYAYLRLIKEKNRKVRVLRRDWKTGYPLETFINSESDDYLYSVDPLGGIFFANNKKSEEYFRMRNAGLQSLWHYALLCKKVIHFN